MELKEWIKQIDTIVNDIVKKQCENFYTDYQQTKIRCIKLESDNKTIQKELDKTKRQLDVVRKQNEWLKTVIDLLDKDWVISIGEDWDSWSDEYWNWWWYRIEFVLYKEERIIIGEETF